MPPGVNGGNPPEAAGKGVTLNPGQTLTGRSDDPYWHGQKGERACLGHERNTSCGADVDASPFRLGHTRRVDWCGRSEIRAFRLQPPLREVRTHRSTAVGWGCPVRRVARESAPSIRFGRCVLIRAATFEPSDSVGCPRPPGCCVTTACSTRLVAGAPPPATMQRNQQVGSDLLPRRGLGLPQAKSSKIRHLTSRRQRRV